MAENLQDSDHRPDLDERPLFPHRPWMVGIVVILGVLSILAGLSDPIWLLLGAPFILTSELLLYVRIVTRNKKD
jgi:hypothetical protein